MGAQNSSPIQPNLTASRQVKSSCTAHARPMAHGPWPMARSELLLLAPFLQAAELRDQLRSLGLGERLVLRTPNGVRR